MKNAVLILLAILTVTGVAWATAERRNGPLGARGIYIRIVLNARWCKTTGGLDLGFGRRKILQIIICLSERLLIWKSFRRTPHAFISAYAYADVYINGRLLERCPMNCDPEYQCYDYFNILPCLQKGTNCIAAIVQNFGVGLHSQINARGGFFFQAKLDFTDSSSVNLLSDSSWKVIHAKAWNTQTHFRAPNAHLIGFVEEFDARLWPDGWQNSGFDDSDWEHAKQIGVPPVAPWNSLVVTERPQLTRTIVKPVRKWKAGNRMVYDFGTEIAGYPRFMLDAAAGGVQFEIGTGERLNLNGVPLVRASSDHSEKYTTKQGLQSWQPFTWTGFRYFSIETRTNIHILDVSAEYSHYSYEMGGSFECSDPRLNEFWKIGKHTMEINSIDTYEDPWREHTQYISRRLALHDDLRKLRLWQKFQIFVGV